MNVLTPIQEAQKVAAQGRHEAILTGPKAVLAAFSEIHRNSGWFVEALKPLKSESASVKSSRSPPSDAQLPSSASSGVRKGPIRVLPERKLGVQTKIWHQQKSCDGSLLLRGLDHMGRRSLPASLQQARPHNAGYALRHQLALLHQQHQQPEQQQAHNDIMAILPCPPPGIHHAHHQRSTSDNSHDSDSISTRSKKMSNACQDNLKPEMTMLDEVVSIDAVLKEKQGKSACAVVHAHKLVGKETEKLDQRAGFKAADVSCHTTRSTQRVPNENTSKNKKTYKSSRLSPRFSTTSSIQDSHLSVPSWVSSTSTIMAHPTVEQQNVLKALSWCPATLHSASTSQGSVILLSLGYKDLNKSPELTAAGTGTTSMRPPSPLLTHDSPFLHKTLTLSNTHVCKPQLTNQQQQQAGGNHCPKALPRPRPGKTAGAAVNHKAVTGVDADCKGGHPHQCPPLNTAQGDTMTSVIINSKTEDPQGLAVNITAMSDIASSDKQLSTTVVGTDGTMSNGAIQFVVPQYHVQYIHDDALKVQKQSSALSPLGALITVETDQGSSEADEAPGKLAVHSAGAPQTLMLNHEVQQQLKPQYSSKGRWWSWLLCGVLRSDKLNQAGKGDEAGPGAECHEVTVSSDLDKLVSAPDFCKEAVPGEQFLAADLSFIHMTAPGEEGCTSDTPSQQAAIISPEGPAHLLCPPDIAASKRIHLEAEPSSAHQKEEECNAPGYANSHRRFTASAALGTVSEISTPTSTAVLPSRRRITSHTRTPSASLSTINGVGIPLYNRCPTDVLPSSLLEDFTNPSAANLNLILGHPAETEQSQPSAHIHGLHELPGESEDPSKGGLLTEGKAETKQVHEVQHEPTLSSDLPLPAFLHKVREALNASVKGHTSYPSPRTAGGILKDTTLDHFRHNLVEARSLVSSRSEGFSHIISPVKVYIEGRLPHSPHMILTGVPASAAHHSKSSSTILLSPRLGSTGDDGMRMNRPAVQLPSICSPRAPLLWRHGGSPSPGGHFPDKALYCPVTPATTASRQGRRCLSARERPPTAWRPSTIFVPSRLSEAAGSTSDKVFTQATPHTAAKHYLDAISIMPGRKTSLAVQLRTVLDALSPTSSDINTAFHALEGKDDVREEREEGDVQEGLLNEKEEAHTPSLPLKILTGHSPSSSDLPLKQLKAMLLNAPGSSNDRLLKASGGSNDRLLKASGSSNDRLLKASGSSNDMLLKASLGSSSDISSSSSSSGHGGLGREVLQSQDDVTGAVHAVETSFVVPRASTLSMSDDQDNVKVTYLKANRLSALLKEKLPASVEESGCTAVLGGDTKGTVQQASLFKVPNHTKRNTAARPSSTGSYNISSLRPFKISGSYAAKAAAAALQSRPGGFSATLSATSNPVAEIAPPLQSSFHVVALDEALINDIDVEVTTAAAEFVQVNENQAEMECKASNIESTDIQPGGSTQPGGSHDVPADSSTDKGTAFEGLDSSAPLQVPNLVNPFTVGRRMTIPTVMKSGLMSSQAALLQDNLIIDWSSSSLLQYQQALDHFSQVLDITFPQHSPFSTSSTRSATATPVPGSPSPDDDSRISSLYSSLFVAEHAAWKGTQSHLMQYSSTHSRSPVGQVMAKTAVHAESPSQAAATRSPEKSKRTSGPHVNSTVSKYMDTNQHKSIRLGKGETRLPYDSTSTKGAISPVIPLSKDVGTRSPHCIQTRQKGAKPATASHGAKPATASQPLLESSSCITHPVPPMMPPAGTCKPHDSLASRSTTYLPGSTVGVLNSLDVDHVLTTSGAKGSTFFSGVEHDRVSGSSTDSKVDLAELTRGTLAAIQAAEEAMRKVQERQLCIYPAGSACWRNSNRSSSMLSKCHGEDESILFSREHQGGDSTVIGFSHMSLELLLPPPAFATSASDIPVDPAKDSSHVVSREQDFKSSSHEQGSGLSSSCDGVPVEELPPPLCSSDKMTLKPSHAGLGSKAKCSRTEAESIHCSGSKACGVKESFATSKATAVKASCVSGGGGDGGRTAAGACIMRITVDVMQED